jgi:hypothetical protein
MTVMIGIDPHKRSHTAVALDEHDAVLGKLRVEPDARQVTRCLRRSRPRSASSGSGHKTHAHDARSTAIAGRHARRLRTVVAGAPQVWAFGARRGRHGVHRSAARTPRR